MVLDNESKGENPKHCVEEQCFKIKVFQIK